MPNFEKLFDMDKEAVNDGRWFEFSEGYKLKIAKWYNANHLKKITELCAEIKEGKTIDQLTDEEQFEIECKAMAGTVLTGWEGFDGDDGKAVLFSDKKAYEWLKFEEFHVQVKNRSYHNANFTKHRTSLLKESLKK